jgi:hypothetical protein
MPNRHTLYARQLPSVARARRAPDWLEPFVAAFPIIGYWLWAIREARVRLAIGRTRLKPGAGHEHRWKGFGRAEVFALPTVRKNKPLGQAHSPALCQIGKART